MTNSLKTKFSVGDWALLYNSRYQHHEGKFQTRWLGPYEIITSFNNGSVQLSMIDPVKFKLLVNGHCLKLYHKPATQEEFLQQFQTPKISFPATTTSESSTEMPATPWIYFKAFIIKFLYLCRMHFSSTSFHPTFLSFHHHTISPSFFCTTLLGPSFLSHFRSVTLNPFAFISFIIYLGKHVILIFGICNLLWSGGTQSLLGWGEGNLKSWMQIKEKY